MTAVRAGSSPAAPGPCDRPTQRLSWIGPALALWVVALLSGVGVLWHYKETPGPTGHVPRKWPADSGIRRTPGRPTLLLFLHPCCPCSSATVGELRGLLPRFAWGVTTYVAALRPAALPDEWDESSLDDLPAALPDATLVRDIEGREAARFGVCTSGHVLLYGAHGELRFSGGVSAARGHMGANPGARALVGALDAELVGERAPPPPTLPVFGCGLLERSSDEDEPHRGDGP